MRNIHERVIEKINREIGDDPKNLHKSKYLIQNFKQQFSDIESKLNLDNQKQTSSIKEALQHQDLSSNAVDFEIEKIKIFEKKLVDRLSECSHVLEEVSPHLDKVKHLEHLIDYLKVVQDIQDINTALNSSVNGKDEAKIVGFYLSLCGEPDSQNSICGRLQQVEAPFLKTFAKNTAIYWHDIIKEKFSKDFETILKNIKWPPQPQVLDSFTPSKDSMNKLSILAEYLLLIKSPIDEKDSLVKITPSIACPPITTPTQLLLKPFRQKFQYHFSGTRQTNRLDKPEWYFTQILNWAKENHLFVGKSFQPAAVKAGHENFNLRLEFIRGLVQLSIEKLVVDIEDVCRDESLFAHLIDETLAFENDLRDCLGYPSSFPSAITVLTQPQYLLKWISIEERFSTDKMDLMLQEGSSWFLIDPSNLDDLKIPKCVDQFIRLLDAIKDRYASLPQPGQQLQFLNLQLELIDNFRRRLVQLHGCGSVESTQILNALNYINSVLREWGENVHYLHLHAAVMGPNASEIDSVFEKCVEELEHWQQKLMKELSSKIVDEIKAKSMPYRHDHWISLPEQNTKEPFILSTTAGEMFQVMMTSLHNLETELSSNLFSTTVRLIAQSLDEFFIDSMIMNTKFSVGGAAQFQYDMTRNLFPLFGQYVRRADLLFKRVHDVCVLLNLPRGSAILLHQTLKDNSTNEHKLITLKEIGVINFKPLICIDILERRTDIRAF